MTRTDSVNAPSVKNVDWRSIGLLLLVNLIALSVFFSPGTGDVEVWEHWMHEIDANGLAAGYASSDTDYPPLCFVILFAVVKGAAALGTSPFLVLKLSLFIFLWATAICFYWFTRNLILTAALEASLLLNSVALAYLDIYFAPFLIAALFLFQRGHFNAGVFCYAVSCMIKWQPLIIGPFILIYVLNAANAAPIASEKIKRRIIPFVASGLLVLIPLLFLFRVPDVLDSFRKALTLHKFLSGYALNLGWLQTWLLHVFDSGHYGPLQNGVIDWVVVRDPLIVWPNKILFFLSYFALLMAFARGRKEFRQLITYSMLGYLAYFCFNTGVHENHLFLVCCVAWLLVFVEPDQFVRSINLSLAANMNLFLFYGAFGQRVNPVFGGFDITVLFVPVNICLFAGFLIETLKTDGVDLGFLKIPPRVAKSDQPSITSSAT